MERHHITAERAVSVLRDYAAHLGQELQVIAQRLVEDRHLPQLETSAAGAAVVDQGRSQLTPRAT
jgi:hypothetical protein